MRYRVSYLSPFVHIYTIHSYDSHSNRRLLLFISPEEVIELFRSYVRVSVTCYEFQFLCTIMTLYCSFKCFAIDYNIQRIEVNRFTLDPSIFCISLQYADVIISYALCMECIAQSVFRLALSDWFWAAHSIRLINCRWTDAFLRSLGLFNRFLWPIDSYAFKSTSSYLNNIAYNLR